ncbi:MAG: TetR/AcrR family transcriptional regulator [Clostridiales bacterium]|nr:TetR/AcrR family transcriptional regulator [Clostridiales bacterium]
MANHKPGKNHDLLKQRILFVAAKDFLEQGYTNTTMRDIATKTKLSSGSVTNLYSSKEDILCGLVQFVFDQQFETAARILSGTTDDKVLLYAAETVLQLHIADLNENLREIYRNAYSFPKSSEIIQQSTTGKVESIFKEYLPDLETKDFFKLEIASGGIMRGFMVVPCSIWFTMEEKEKAFLENALLIYHVPEEKIREAVEFVKQFDFDKIAQTMVDGIIQYLEEKQKELFS